MSIHHDPDRTSRMCALFRIGIKPKEIAAQFEVQTPAVYKALRRGGVLAPYRPNHISGRGRPSGGGNPGYTSARREKAASKQAAFEAAIIIAVDRTPCRTCGSRGDLGCEHSWTARQDAAFCDLIADGALIADAARTLNKSHEDGTRHFARVCHALGWQAA